MASLHVINADFYDNCLKLNESEEWMKIDKKNSFIPILFCYFFAKSRIYNQESMRKLMNIHGTNFLLVHRIKINLKSFCHRSRKMHFYSPFFLSTKWLNETKLFCKSPQTFSALNLNTFLCCRWSIVLISASLLLQYVSFTLQLHFTARQCGQQKIKKEKKMQYILRLSCGCIFIAIKCILIYSSPEFFLASCSSSQFIL